MTLDPTTALANLPAGLRQELLDEFQKITKNYRERRWEAAELDGGRFSEVAYSILEGHLKGSFPASASKPSNFEDSCRNLRHFPGTFSDSARLTIPRVLVSLYDIRNRRGVGHVGGEVNANHMDAEFVLHSVQWVMAEFVRMFHGTDVQTATSVVDALVERTVPLIWEVNGARRVLHAGMKLADKTLLLLYASTGEVNDRALAKDLEQSRFTDYKRVLSKLHKGRMIEHNTLTGTVTLSPLGIKDVEERLLKT